MYEKISEKEKRAEKIAKVKTKIFKAKLITFNTEVLPEALIPINAQAVCR